MDYIRATDLTAVDQELLLGAIARREGTLAELSKWYGVSTASIRLFTEAHRDMLEDMRAGRAAHVELHAPNEYEPPEDVATVTPTQLDELWLSNKFERLRRYQEVADMLYKDMVTGGGLSGSDLSTAAREFRSYAQLAANELGQLLHRGAGDSGDGDTMSIDIGGIDISSLR